MTVFVVQSHLRYDPEKGRLVSRYDVSPAAEWGEIHFLLPPRATVDDPEQTVAVLDAALRHYTDQDYLLLIGHPVLIGWATALAAAHNFGRVNCLVWSNRTSAYTVVESCLPIHHASL